MAARKITPSQEAAVHRLLQEGKTNAFVAAKVGISPTSVSEIRNGDKRWKESGKKDPLADPEPLDPSRVGQPIDDRKENEGDTSIITPDKPLTIAEMADLFGIDMKVWQPISIRSNQWQGFYKASSLSKVLPDKSKETTAKHSKVALWQTRVSWKRVCSKGLEAAVANLVHRTVKPLPPLKGRAATGRGDFAVAWGLWDVHLGMLAWADEVGQHYDLTIAKDRVMRSIDDMAKELEPYSIEKVWMPVGNDFMHFDNIKQNTTKGDHHLDSDGRYGKVYAVAIECLCYLVETAARISREVDVFYIPGNHDMLSSFTLCHVLKQRYRGDGRISVDVGFNPRKHREFGGTRIAFDHGEGANAQQLAMAVMREIQSSPSREKVTYSELQIGHFHQRREREIPLLTPTNGLVVWTNPSLSGVDSWHHKGAMLGEPGKSVEARRYDRTGYRGSHVAWVRPD